MLRKEILCSEIKVNVEKGTMEGYASVFDVVDSQAHDIKQGAYAETIRAPKRNQVLLWRHREPFGSLVHLEEDSKGLFFKAKASDLSTTKDRLTLVKDNVVKGVSVGIDPVSWISVDLKEYEGKLGDVRIPSWKSTIKQLVKVDLWEISNVIWGANPKAEITRVNMAEQFAYDISKEKAFSKIELEELKNLLSYLSTFVEEEKTDNSENNKEELDISKFTKTMDSFLKDIKK